MVVKVYLNGHQILCFESLVDYVGLVYNIK